MIWPVLDQGLISGVRFLIVLFIARYLGVEQFSQYTLAWTFILLFVSLHVVLVQIPALHFLALGGGSRGVTKTVVDSVNYQFLCLFILIVAFLGFFWSGGELTFVLAMLFYSVVYMQYEYLRRKIMAEGGYEKCFYYDVGISGCYLASAAWVYFFDLSVEHLVACIGLTKVLYTLLTKHQLFPVLTTAHFKVRSKDNYLFVGYSKDTLLLTVSQYISGHLFIYFVAILFTFQELAYVGAVKSLLGPLIVMFIVVDNVLTPQFSSRVSNMDLAPSAILFPLFVVLVLVVVVIIPLAIFPVEILNFVYGDGYREAGVLLKLFAISFVAMAITRVVLVYLRAIGEGKIIRESGFFVLVISVLITYPALYVYGLNGAGIVVVVQQFAIASFLCFFAFRKSGRLTGNE